MNRLLKLLIAEIGLLILSVALLVGIFIPCSNAGAAEQFEEADQVQTLVILTKEIIIEPSCSLPPPRAEDIIIPLPYDVPVSKETQTYILELCLQYGVPEKLVYAIMAIESNFTPDVISYSNDYGIMQINSFNHEWLSEKLGITDFLDERQNILAGVYILSNLYGQFDTMEEVLLAYNRGPSGARKLLKQGITQTEYTQSVMEEMECLRRPQEDNNKNIFS